MNLQQSAKDRAEQLTADRLSVEKFAVGQSVPRKEDPMLLRGQGHYTDDVSLPGQAYAVMVRSQNAHGVIRSIDTEAARKMPGVLGVYTAADLKGYGPLKCVVPFNNRDGSPMKKPLREALAVGKVRYVGDPVAFVVAETVHAAKDAAEAVVVDIESLPSVTAAEAAAQARRAAALRRRAGQCGARLSLWRRRSGQSRLRQGRPCHQAATRQQPARRRRHGAARRARRL